MKKYYVYNSEDGKIVLVDDVSTFISQVYSPEFHKYSGIMISVTEGKTFNETIDKACKLYENPASGEGDVFAAEEPKAISTFRESYQKMVAPKIAKERDAAISVIEKVRQSLKTVADIEAKKVNKDPEFVFELIKSTFITQIEKMKYEDEV
jgi:hypothetical protein